MEDTALGASALLHDLIHQTDQSKLQHYTNGGMVHSQADQHGLVRVEQSEVSEQARARGRKDKLSEAQKREKKRQCDVNYRLKKKIKENEMTAQNESLQEEIGRLSTENRQLKEETGQLTAENKRLEEHIRQLQSKGKLPAEVLSEREGSYISQSTDRVDHQSVHVQEMNVQNKCLQEEIGRLSTENRHLKEKTGRLTTKNGHLEEHIRQLQSKGKLPAENVQCQILAMINITTQHYLSIEAENSVLRAQLMELCERLRSLNEIIYFINESNDAFDGEGTSLAFIQPAESESDSFLNRVDLLYLNQPMVEYALLQSASADINFRY